MNKPLPIVIPFNNSWRTSTWSVRKIEMVQLPNGCQEERIELDFNFTLERSFEALGIPPRLLAAVPGPPVDSVLYPNHTLVANRGADGFGGR